MKRKKSSKKKILIISGICLLIIILVSALELRSENKTGYSEETAKTQDIITYHSYSGNIEAKNRQRIIGDTIMQIKTIYMNEGDIVTAGDVLIKTTQGQEIKAKIPGEVGEILLEEGAAITPGTAITTITDYSNLQVTVRVDEYDIAAMKVDKEVTVFINAMDKEIKGKIAKVSKEAMTLNGVSFFTATIDLEKNEELLVGMSTEVTMVNESANDATTISMKALQFDNENNPFVYYRDHNDKVDIKEVAVGINDGNIVQILDGIKPGEVLLIPFDNSNNIVTPLDMARNSRRE